MVLHSYSKSVSELVVKLVSVNEAIFEDTPPLAFQKLGVIIPV